MKQAIRVATLLLITLFTAPFAMAQQEQWQWVKQFGSALSDIQNNDDEEIIAMQVDDSGNVYLAGSVWGDVNIDSNTFNHPSLSLSGFVNKFDCAGNLLWHKRIDYPYDMVISKTTKKVYVAAGKQILSVHPSGDTTVVFESSLARILNIAIDENDNIYSLTYGNSSQYTPLYYMHPDSNYIAKHDSTGAIIYFKSISKRISGGGLLSDNPYLNIDNSGHIYIAGTTVIYGSFILLGGDTINPNANMHEGFIVKLDNSGNHIWTKQSSGGGEINGFNLNDNDQPIFTFAAIEFNGTTASGYIRRPNFTNLCYNAAIMNSSGDIIYHDNFGQYPIASPQAMADCITMQGDRLIIGLEFNEQSNFQFGTVITPYISSSNIIKTPGFLEFDTLADDGVNYQYLTINNTTTLNSKSIKVSFDNLGNRYISGIVPTSIIFNGQTLPYQGGDYDLFVAKWGIDSCPVPVVNTFVCAQPQQLAVQNVDSNSALVSWVDSANTGSYTVQWGTAGFVLGSGDSATTTNLSYNLTGLQPNTAYEVYARTNCANELSNYSNAVSFTTDSLATTPPDTGTNPGDTTGIEALSAWKNQVKVYPNPANNQLVVAFGNNNNIKEITVFSITGSLIYQTSNITDNQCFIETTNWPQGMYVLQLTTTNGTTENRRFSVGH